MELNLTENRPTRRRGLGAWLFGFGTEVEILSPPSARLEMQNMLAAAADLYAPPRRQ